MKKFICVLLVLVMVFSLLPAMAISASAVDYGSSSSASEVVFDTGSITAAKSFLWDNSAGLAAAAGLINAALTGAGLPGIANLSNVSQPSDTWFAFIDGLYSKVGYGSVSLSSLSSIDRELSNFCNHKLQDVVIPIVGRSVLWYWFPDLSVSLSDFVSLELSTISVGGTSKKVYRPYFHVTSTTGFFIVDSHGAFPYAIAEEETAHPTISYNYYNRNIVDSMTNSAYEVSADEMGKLVSVYGSRFSPKYINEGNFTYSSYTSGSSELILCAYDGTHHYAVHTQYRNQNTGTLPSIATDTGFSTVFGNYVLDTLSASKKFNFALVNEYEFQSAASNPYTSVINLDITGTDGTVYPMYALSYGSLSGNYQLDLTSGKTNIPGQTLWFYKMTDAASKVFAVGNSQLGVPYVFGGNTPGVEWDCSAFVSYCLGQAGVWQGGRVSAQALYNGSSRITAADLRPGDLVFFTGTYDSGTPVSHVGIYAGAGVMLHAGSGYVQYTNISTSVYKDKVYGYGRIGTYATNNLVLYPRSDGDYVIDDTFRYYTEGDNYNFNTGITSNSQFIDNSNSTVINISGGDGFSQAGGNALTLYLDDLIYDESTKTYTSSSHQAYELANGDNYITVNYNYEYNFYVDYTSITYIGTTADANETYNFYYELPDGRSSSDLSADDLLALNTQIDVLPYNRSTDDTRLRSLYHFNGNTLDSSYWNYETDFTWNTGASITYLDAGQNFQGALYLDELEHDFTITLPSTLGSDDFTIEWRYYQSYTAAPQTDSYVQIGTTKLLQFDGAHYKKSSGTIISDTSVGSWSALCLMRSSNTLYFFVNGVSYNLGSFSLLGDSYIKFHFGSSQQTYKQIDELRVLNFANYSTSGYTPAATQFDSNLALVLPTDSVPVADEYWDITMTGTNLLSQYNLDWWDEQHGDSGLFSSDFSSSSGNYFNSVSTLVNGYSSSVPVFNVSYVFIDSSRPSVGWLNLASSSISSSSSLSDIGYSYVLGSYGRSSYVGSGLSGYFPCGLNLFPRMQYSSYLNTPTTLSSGSTYTLSMVSASGDVGSFSFVWPSSSLYLSSESITFDYVEFNGYRLGLFLSKYNSTYSVALSIVPLSTSGEFVYLALEEGTESSVTAEYVTSVVGIPEDDLAKATLAVRTDLSITKWSIGGVRPSIPERGNVWALVEDGIITSLQIFDGYGWTDVDGRIWTGERFVPLGSYNIVTMNDLLDLIGTSPGYNPIYTESGFWKWLQEAWKNMIQLLTDIRDKLGGTSSDDNSGGGGHGWLDDDDDDSDDHGIVDLFKTLMRGLGNFAGGMTDLVFDGNQGLSDWVDDTGGFFDSFDVNSPNSIFSVEIEEGSGSE